WRRGLYRCWHSESLICGSPERPLVASGPAYAPDHESFASSREQLAYQLVCMLDPLKSIEIICPTLGRSVFSNSVTSRQFLYEKLEKQPLWSIVGRPWRLLIRHSSSNSEVFGLLCHVIIVNVERYMLPQLSLSRNLWSCEPILLSTARALSGLDVNRQSCRHGDFHRR